MAPAESVGRLGGHEKAEEEQWKGRRERAAPVLLGTAMAALPEGARSLEQPGLTCSALPFKGSSNSASRQILCLPPFFK